MLLHLSSNTVEPIISAPDDLVRIFSLLSPGVKRQTIGIEGSFVNVDYSEFALLKMGNESVE